MIGADRNELRSILIDAWQKYLIHKRLSPLEKQIANILLKHPEHQAEMRYECLEAEYPPEQGEVNPFLHIAFHLSIHDQVVLDRPPGVRDIYEKTLEKATDAHELQHEMMSCLAEFLWVSQHSEHPPSDEVYLTALRTQLKRTFNV